MADFISTRWQRVSDRRLCSGHRQRTEISTSCPLLSTSRPPYNCDTDDRQRFANRVRVARFSRPFFCTDCPSTSRRTYLDRRTNTGTTSSRKGWACSPAFCKNFASVNRHFLEFRRNSTVKELLTENGKVVERIDTFKFLGTHIASDLTWNFNTAEIHTKAQQRLYFLQCLKKFGLRKRNLVKFYLM